MSTSPRPIALLLVDDDPMTRRILCLVCSALEGVDVTEASNLAEVESLIRRGHHFDVAFVDLILDGERGDAVARYLRTCSSPCPSVVITGNADAVLQGALGESADFAAALPKPLTHTTIEAVLHDLSLR